MSQVIGRSVTQTRADRSIRAAAAQAAALFWNFNFPLYNPCAPLPQTATVYFIEAHGQIAGLIGPG